MGVKTLLIYLHLSLSMHGPMLIFVFRLTRRLLPILYLMSVICGDPIPELQVRYGILEMDHRLTAPVPIRYIPTLQRLPAIIFTPILFASRSKTRPDAGILYAKPLNLLLNLYSIFRIVLQIESQHPAG